MTEQLGSTPELLGAVRTRTNDAGVEERMAPHEGRGRELRVGGGSCQGPYFFLSLSQANYDVYVIIHVAMP